MIIKMIKPITNDICIALIISEGIRLCRFKWSINNEKIRIRPKNENHRSHIRIKTVFEHWILLWNDWLIYNEIVTQRKMIV